MDEQKNNSQTDTKIDTTKESSSMNSPQASGGVSSGMMVGVVVVALIIAGALFFFFQSDTNLTGDTTTDISLDMNSSEEYPEVVATVNGEALSKADFATSFSQAQQSAQQQGANPSDPAVFEQIEALAMDTLINTTLLLQVAKESDVSISDEQVEAELEGIKAQFPDEAAFETILSEQNITVEQLRENIFEQLLINEYLATSGAIEEAVVSPEDVQAAYDSLATGGQELPPLEQIYAVLEQQLSAQQSQSQIGTFIESLRAEAEIEVNI